VFGEQHDYMVKSMDKREYDQLDSLSSSSNMEISRLGVIVKNLKDRMESLERNQTELMDKLNALEKKE
jgi:predicted transcriptional regulator